MVLQLFGTVGIAGIAGYVSERSGLTRNGYIPSIIICVGGAFLFCFIRIMFGIRFGAPGLDAILSSVGRLSSCPPIGAGGGEPCRLSGW